jgi:hypothetical protein
MCEHERKNQQKKTTAMNWKQLCLGTDNFNLCSHCKILLLLLFHSTFRSFQSGEKMSAKSHGAFTRLFGVRLKELVNLAHASNQCD